MATIPLTDSGLKKEVADNDKPRLQGEKPTNNIPDGGGLVLKR